ncbi:hypothetical protein RYX36_025386, partial [Vicia faba]
MVVQSHKSNNNVHVLVIPYPAQGHISPLIQFAKRLLSKNIKTTFATTHYTVQSITAQNITVEPISDGFDQSGFSQANDVQLFLTSFESNGYKTPFPTSLCRLSSLSSLSLPFPFFNLHPEPPFYCHPAIIITKPLPIIQHHHHRNTLSNSLRLCSPLPNPNTLVGAMVAGPDRHDGFHDVRSNYNYTEPTLAGNAGLVAALVALS